MTYLTIAALELLALSLFTLKISDDICSGFTSSTLACVGCVGAVLGAVGLSVVLVFGYDWVASEHKAKIVNREYGTNYTREDIFYASDVIDTIREVQRQRIELNGDLLRGEGK